MKIAGFQKFTLIDYPGMISAIIFTQGCNFRCPWCHNPELVLPELYKELLDKNEILDFLKTRIGKLDAVTITGGEPTLHQDLPDFIKTIKEMGFKIKLDTNGTNPLMLKTLLRDNLIDYFAMDIKTSLENYSEVIGEDVDVYMIKESIEVIKESGIDYEFRTTMIPSLMNEDDIFQIETLIGDVNRYYIQHLECKDTLDINFSDDKATSEILWDKIKDYTDKKENYLIR